MIPSMSTTSRRRASRRVRSVGAGAVIAWALERAVRCRVGTRSALAQEGLAAGPVAHDEQGVLVAGIAGRVEQPWAPLRRALPDPPAVILVERGGLGVDGRGQPVPAGEEA